MLKRLAFSLVLVMVFSLSVAASDIYSDVPADHWAYQSVKKLVDAGVLSGFPDGEFKGDALLTRYEMATYTARAIDYVVTNVERMNRTQAAVITKTLDELVTEFDRELTMLALDTRAVKLELERLKASLEPWVVKASVTVQSETVEVEGSAFEDPFAADLKAVDPKAGVEARFDATLSGKLSGYNVEFAWAGSGTWDAFNSEYYPTVERVFLKAYGNGHTVVAGTLEDVAYNDFILSDDDRVVFGLKATVDSGMLHTDRFDITVANYLDHMGTRGVLATEATKSVFDWTVKAFAGVHLDSSASSDFVENTVLGVNAARVRDDYSITGTFARDKAGNTSKSVGIGYKAIDSLDLELEYTDIENGFSGILASVDPEKTFVVKGTIGLTEYLNVYYEGTKDFNGPEGLANRIGARVKQYRLLPGFNINLDAYNVSGPVKQVFGYAANTEFALGPMAKARLAYGAEDGKTSLVAELNGEHQVGPVAVNGAIKYQSEEKGNFTKYHLGLEKMLSDVTRIGLNYDVSHYVDAKDQNNNFDVTRFFFFINASF